MRCRFVLPAIALVVTVLPGNAPAQFAYDFTLVEAFNDTYPLREVYLRDINESGVACGTSTYQSSYAGFVWTEADDKSIVPITWTRGINNANQVVGDNRVFDVGTGQSTIVPPAGGWPLTRLMGINDNGIVVGFAECSCSNSDGVLQSALVWDAGAGSRTTGIAAARELVRINNDNVAVGNIRPSAGSSEAFVFDVDTGASTNLSDLLPSPPFGRPWSEASDINAAGEVCGQGYDGTITRGMVWSPGGGFTFLPALDGGDPMRVHPLGLNDDGVVVGRALSGTTGDWDAFVWDPVNGIRNLDALVAAPSGFTLDWATEINETGWIVGIGHQGPGWNTSRGFVLKPLSTGATSSPVLALPGDGLELRVAPNPAAETVEIRWSAPPGAPARLTLLDVRGRVVATDLAGSQRGGAGGATSVSWQLPGHVPAGVYFVRLESGERTTSRRLVVVR